MCGLGVTIKSNISGKHQTHYVGVLWYNPLNHPYQTCLCDMEVLYQVMTITQSKPSNSRIISKTKDGKKRWFDIFIFHSILPLSRDHIWISILSHQQHCLSITRYHNTIFDTNMQSSSSSSYPSRSYPSADQNHQVNCDYFTMQHFSQLISQSMEYMPSQQHNHYPNHNHNSMNMYESVNDGAGHVNYASLSQVMNESINQLSAQYAMSQSVRPRKSRHIKTTHAMRTLKQLFVENCKPSKDAMRSMTLSTGCTYAEVCRWFRNERHKAKKAKINYQLIKQSNKSNRPMHQATDQSTNMSSSADHSATSSTSSSPSTSRTVSSYPLMTQAHNHMLHGQASSQGHQAFFPSIHHHPVEVAQWMSTFHNFDFENLDKM